MTGNVKVDSFEAAIETAIGSVMHLVPTYGGSDPQGNYDKKISEMADSLRVAAKYKRAIEKKNGQEVPPQEVPPQEDTESTDEILRLSELSKISKRDGRLNLELGYVMSDPEAIESIEMSELDLCQLIRYINTYCMPLLSRYRDLGLSGKAEPMFTNKGIAFIKEHADEMRKGRRVKFSPPQLRMLRDVAKNAGVLNAMCEPQDKHNALVKEYGVA